MQRRDVMIGLASLLAAAALFPRSSAGAVPPRRKLRRRKRRRVRRRVRRRHRRRVRRRVIAGAAFFVVPTAMVVGWELQHEDTVYEVVAVDKQDDGTEVATLKDPAGQQTKMPVVREDDDVNSKELEGSVLPDADTTTPGVESEIEEDVEEDVDGDGD